MGRVVPASLALLALLLMMVMGSYASGYSYGPVILNNTLAGRGFEFNYTLIAEPLVEGQSTLIMMLYSFSSHPNVTYASIWSQKPMESSEVKYEPEGFSRILGLPLDFGVIAFNVTPVDVHPGEYVNLSLGFTLDIRYSSGDWYRGNITLPLRLWILAGEGSVPKAIAYGVVASLLVVVSSPLTAFIYIRGKRRASLTLAALVAVMVTIMLVLAVPRFEGSDCGAGDLILRYIWASPRGAAGVLYVWSDDAILRFLNLTYTIPPIITDGTGCPAPICTDSVQGVEKGYYYHNALRRARIHDIEEGEAIYGYCGYLFRLYRRVEGGAWLYMLNASLGHEPPIEPGYYAKLLLAPPLLSIITTVLVLYKGVRRGVVRHG